MKVTFLGTRGSVPAAGREYLEFGGESSCIMVQTAGALVFLDAGTGILYGDRYIEGDPEEIHILLSHGHMDHLLGLLFWRRLFVSGTRIHIHGRAGIGMPVRQQIQRLMEHPLWPVGPENYQPEVFYHDEERDCFRLGDIEAASFELVHPGGAAAYRLSCQEASMVYATDTEYECPPPEDFLTFVRGCGLLVMDGQFTREEYERKKGWGHSSHEVGLWLSLHQPVGQVKLFHHDLRAEDPFLRQVQRELMRRSSSCSLAKQGEVMEL